MVFLLGFAVSVVFANCAFPRCVFLRQLPALFLASASSCSSSLVFFLPLVAISSFLVCHVSIFLMGFSSYSVGSLHFGSYTVRCLLHSCWVSLPYVLCGLLFLASFRSVLAFFLFASFVTRSNLSCFSLGSSLWAESPLLVVAYHLSRGLGSCPLVFGTLPLVSILLSFLLLFVEWVTLLYVVSSLEFLYLSLFVGCLLFPVCICFSFSWRFSQLTYVVAIFSCYIHVRLQLCYTFTLFCCTFFPYRCSRETSKFPRLLPQFFSFDSSVHLRPLHLASSSIPSGPL